MKQPWRLLGQADCQIELSAQHDLFEPPGLLELLKSLEPVGHVASAEATP